MRNNIENRIQQGEKLLEDHGSRYDLPVDFVVREMQKVLSARSEAERGQRLFELIGRVYYAGLRNGYRMAENVGKRRD